MLTEAVMCLALNIYHEARGEPLAGQIAVAEVVLNRVESPKFPDTICEVVHQGEYYQTAPIRNRCQFSWWCDGKSDIPKDTTAWQQISELANKLVSRNHIDITEGSLYYHTKEVNPYWSKAFEKTVIINSHIFYR